MKHVRLFRLLLAATLPVVMLLLLGLVERHANARETLTTAPAGATPESRQPDWQWGGPLGRGRGDLAPTLGRTFYVDANYAGEQEGTPARPWRTVGQALKTAGNGDAILVAGGVYSENLVISRSVQLAGGHAPSSSPISWTRSISTFPTIVDGRQLGSVLTISGSVNALVTGLTLTNGRAGLGGGIHVEHAWVTLNDDTIIGNSATGAHGSGGGLYALASALTISKTRFLKNTATDWGGGLYLMRSYATIDQATFATNTVAGGGGGLFAEQAVLDLAHSVVISNTADCCGGGVGGQHSTLVLNHNQISYNRVDPASSFGGGIYARDGVVHIDANTVTYNRAFAGAGIVSGAGDSELVNNFIARNDGGGILVQSGAIINNTIRHNGANDYGDHGEGILISPAADPSIVNIINNIVIGNAYGITRAGSGVTITLLRNDVWGNQVADYAGVERGSTDMAADPLLAVEIQDGYRLLPGSPCIDTGVAASAPATDFDDEPRPLDGDIDGNAVVDIGADEFKHPPTTPTATPTPLSKTPLRFPLFLRDHSWRMGG
jgi:hypothetical protein